MTFQEFWDEVVKTKILPNTAIQHIPYSLSEKVEKKLMMVDPQKVAELLEACIDQINLKSNQKQRYTFVHVFAPSYHVGRRRAGRGLSRPEVNPPVTAS